MARLLSKASTSRNNVSKEIWTKLQYSRSRTILKVKILLYDPRKFHFHNLRCTTFVDDKSVAESPYNY